jgi:hypothetical protein
MPDYRPWYPRSQASANSSYIALLIPAILTSQAFNLTISLTISDSSKESGAARTRRTLSLARAFPATTNPHHRTRKRGGNSVLITD